MYPQGSPAFDMSTNWQSGEFSPDTIVRTIRDNYTPINKNSMRNSVGQEISLVQNYVNSHYLGREDIPIQTGFINELWNYSGHVYIYQSGYDAGYDSFGIINSGILNASSLYLSHSPQDLLKSYTIYGTSGIYGAALNSASENQGHEWYLYPNHLSMYNAGPPSVINQFGLYDAKLDIIPSSGICIRHIFDLNEDEIKINIKPSGFNWTYKSYDESIQNATCLNINSSGNFISYPSGEFVINSGEPYLGMGNGFSLTIGQHPEFGGGDLFVKTHGGGGIAFTGDNGLFDRITSYAPETLHLQCGSSNININNSGVIGLPADATDPTSSYALINAIKACLIERGWATAI